jgi:hypothetical protein
MIMIFQCLYIYYVNEEFDLVIQTLYLSFENQITPDNFGPQTSFK